MEKKGYPKNYLNKFFLFFIIIGGSMFVFLYWVCKHSEKEMQLPDLDETTAPPLISMNIKCQDSTYCIVLEEGELSSILKGKDKKITSQMKLSYKDTVIVDSLSLIQLKDYIVIPQHRIDSIYKSEGVKGLLIAYFDDVWFIPYCEEGILTLPEQRYIIDILHRHGYSTIIDCESGCLYIIKSIHPSG